MFYLGLGFFGHSGCCFQTTIINMRITLIHMHIVAQGVVFYNPTMLQVVFIYLQSETFVNKRKSWKKKRVLKKVGEDRVWW